MLGVVVLHVEFGVRRGRVEDGDEECRHLDRMFRVKEGSVVSLFACCYVGICMDSGTGENIVNDMRQGELGSSGIYIDYQLFPLVDVHIFPTPLRLTT